MNRGRLIPPSARRCALHLATAATLLAFAASPGRAQLFFTNSNTAGSGNWAALPNWTNADGSAITLAAAIANWDGSNLVFNTTGGENTNNVTTKASFGWVTWTASTTTRSATAANPYFWTGFTNKGNNTVLFAPKVTFSNAAAVYNEGTVTLSGVMTNLAGGITFRSAAGATTTVSGVIGQAAGITKDGAGALVLSAANTYTGETVLNSGTLRLGNNTALGGGTFTINGGGLDVTGARTTTSNNPVNINGDFVYYGGNTLNLGTGAVTINAARSIIVTNSLTIGGTISGAGGLNALDLTVGGSGSLIATNASGITLRAGGQTGTVNNAATLQVGGAISGPGSLDAFDVVKKGAGTLILDSGVTLTGNRTVTGATAGILQINGSISDGGAGYGLTNASMGGTLSLAGANNYDGATFVASGAVLRIMHPAALGSAVGHTVVANGGQLRVQASMTNAENMILSGPSAAANNAGTLVQQINSGVTVYDGQITLDGGATIASFNAGAARITITKGIDGTGDLTLNATSANNGDTTFYLNGQSTYTGNTFLKSFQMSNRFGLYELGTNNVFPTTTVLNMQAVNNQANYLKVKLNGFSQDVSGLVATNTSGTVSTNIIVGGSPTLSILTVSNSADSTFDGNLGGPLADENNLALVKTGPATLLLSSKNGGNTYAGGTTIAQGLLTALHTNALPGYATPGSITVAGGSAVGVRAGGAGEWASSDINTLLANAAFANNGAALGVDTTGGSFSHGGAITGEVAFLKLGANSLILTAAGDYTGLTIVHGGTLVAAHGQALGSTAGITVVTNSAVVALSNNVTVAEDVTVYSAISGGAVRSSGGSNTWAGLITMAVGGGRIGADAGSVLRLAGGVKGTGSSVMYLAPADGGMVVVDSPITNAGSNVNFLNGGTNYLSVGGHDWLQSTVYYRNVLILGANDALPTGVRLTVGGSGAQTNGTVLMNGMNQTLSRLESGTPDGNNDLIANTAPTLSTLTVNQTVSTLYGGLLNGNLALVKGGSATLTLTNGNSTFTGGATVIAGTLALAGAGTPGTGPLDVRPSATLTLESPYTLASGQTLTNFGTVTGGLIVGAGARATGGGSYLAVTNAAGGTLTPGAGSHTNTMASLTLMGGSTNAFRIAGAATHDMTVVTNSLGYGGDRPLLRLDLTDWANESSGYVVLYNNLADVTAWDGTAQYFQLADWGAGPTSDGLALTEGTTFGVNGGLGHTNTQFIVHYAYDGATGTPGGNDVVLTVVPEPATLSMAGLFGAALLWLRRRLR